VREARAGRQGARRISFDILQHVEHMDLISYGLIPEFVGRLPVIVALQVGRAIACIWPPGGGRWLGGWPVGCRC
jgi:hypothetical protein